MLDQFRKESPTPSVSENFDGDPAKLTLYQFQSCPFCALVRDALAQLKLEIAMKDTIMEPDVRQELIEGGGRKTVPCLRIEGTDGEVEWMYESRDIVSFLRHYFG